MSGSQQKSLINNSLTTKAKLHEPFPVSEPEWHQHISRLVIKQFFLWLLTLLLDCTLLDTFSRTVRPVGDKKASVSLCVSPPGQDSVCPGIYHALLQDMHNICLWIALYLFYRTYDESFGLRSDFVGDRDGRSCSLRVQITCMLAEEEMPQFKGVVKMNSGESLLISESEANWFSISGLLKNWFQYSGRLKLSFQYSGWRSYANKSWDFWRDRESLLATFWVGKLFAGSLLQGLF